VGKRTERAVIYWREDGHSSPGELILITGGGYEGWPLGRLPESQSSSNKGELQRAVRRGGDLSLENDLARTEAVKEDSKKYPLQI